MKSRLAILASILFALTACEGPTGPMGPQGEIGPEGPQGPQGPGSVFASAMVTADAEGYATGTLENYTGGLENMVLQCWARISDGQGDLWIQIATDWTWDSYSGYLLEGTCAVADLAGTDLVLVAKTDPGLDVLFVVLVATP